MDEDKIMEIPVKPAQAQLEPPVSKEALRGDAQVAEQAPTVAPQVQSFAAAPTPLAIGSLIRGESYAYRIEEFISTAGPVNLYRVSLEDASKEQRIALLKESSCPSGGQDPLEHEFKALQEANYRLLPAVYEYFSKEGKAYLTLEWLEGPKLSEAIAQGSFSVYEGTSILIQVCQAMRKLHNKGWVHLSLSPDNIVFGKPIKVKGLERVARAGESPVETFSIPSYTAPEVARGALVDGRADIYSIGAILYRLETGEPLPETGPELVLIEDKLKTPGVPQVLSKCLGEPDTRFSHIDGLMKMLLQLKVQLTPALRYSVGFETSIGRNPSRTVNEDSFGYVEKTAAFESKMTSYGFYCVADGMGGMEAGEVASRVAVEAALQEAMNTAFPALPSISVEEQAQLTKSIVATANKAVCEHATKKTGSNMGTTFTCALIIGGHLTLGHVGDTRVYLIRGGEINLLTEDHSLVTPLLKSGQITQEEARKHPDKNKLFRSLGSNPVLPDYYVEGLEKVTGQKGLAMKAGDFLLLCTDGFWGDLEDHEILAKIREGGSLQEVSEGLVQFAHERSGMDNITVGLLRVVGIS